MRAYIGSLLQKRDDLPEMRVPLLVAAMIVTCVTGGSAVLCIRGGLGFLVLPMVLLAVMSQAFLILLRRHPAVLAVPLAVGGILLGTAGGWFWAVAGTVCLLLLSCTCAALFLTKESRFVRIASVACVMGVCMLATGIVYISWQFDTLSAAVVYVCETWQEPVAAVLSALSGGTYVLLPETVNRVLYQIMGAVPALVGMFCVGCGALLDGGMRFFFWLFDCSAYFVPEEEDITLPRSFGVLYGVVFFLVTATSSTGSPHIYSILSNCHWVLSLPCAWVGITAIYRKLREGAVLLSLYGTTKSHSPIPAVVILVCFFLFMPTNIAFMLMALYGAGCTIFRHTETERS